ncbi:MAG: hypothetical protein VX764_05645 [Planctomycetota bacterium]|nr:hypothetical protein [Planctomycetota bacterium]
MTNNNKHEDKDRKKLDDQQLEEVAGGLVEFWIAPSLDAAAALVKQPGVTKGQSSSAFYVENETE